MLFLVMELCSQLESLEESEMILFKHVNSAFNMSGQVWESYFDWMGKVKLICGLLLPYFDRILKNCLLLRSLYNYYRARHAKKTDKSTNGFQQDYLLIPQ